MEQQQLDLYQASTSQIVKQLKNDGQDFEWYPTTNEMLNVVANDIHSCNFIGNGHKFKKHRTNTKYWATAILKFISFICEPTKK